MLVTYRTPRPALATVSSIVLDSLPSKSSRMTLRLMKQPLCSFKRMWKVWGGISAVNNRESAAWTEPHCCWTSKRIWVLFQPCSLRDAPIVPYRDIVLTLKEALFFILQQLSGVLRLRSKAGEHEDIQWRRKKKNFHLEYTRNLGSACDTIFLRSVHSLFKYFLPILFVRAVCSGLVRLHPGSRRIPIFNPRAQSIPPAPSPAIIHGMEK